MSCTTEKGDCIHAHWLVTSTDQVYLRSVILGKHTEIDRCPHVILKSVHAKPCILPAFFVLNWWLNTYQKLNINQESPPHLKCSWNGMEMKKSTHTYFRSSSLDHMFEAQLHDGTSFAVDLAQETNAKIPRWRKDCMYSSHESQAGWCYGACDCALLLISQLPWERNCIPSACEIECTSEVTARCCNRKNLGRYRGWRYSTWTPYRLTRCAKSV